MRTNGRKLWIAAAAAAVLGASFSSLPEADAQAAGGKLTVNASGFRNTKGQALLSVYKDDDSFLEMDEAVKTMKKKLTGGNMQFVVEGLPAGVYAVGVLHDEDSNNDLAQWLGFGPPKEGVGMSRNPDGFPKWEKCKFKLEPADQTIDIKIRYLGEDAK